MRAPTLLILTLLTLSLFAQDKASRGPAYVYDIWRVEHGLPSNDVRSVIQTRDGFVWAATVKGLARFDGASFRTFNSTNTPEFKQDIVNQLCEDKNGALWIGIDAGGLVHYKDGVFSQTDVPPVLRTGFIRKIYEDRSGRLWIGTPRALFVKDKGGFEEIRNFRGPVNDIVQDREGNIIVAAGALYVVNDRGFREMRLASGIDGSVSGISPASDGTYWMSTAEALYHVLPQTNGGLATVKKIYVARRVSMLLDESPGVWLMTSFGRGIERLAGGTLYPIRGLSGLRGASLNARKMVRGREGGIWVATGGGLLRLNQTFVWFLSTREGLNDTHIWSVYSAHDGSVWAGRETGGMFNLRDGKVVHSLTVRDGLPADRISAINEMSGGSLWIGGYPEGLARRVNGRFEDMSRYPGFRGGSVRTLYEDSRRRIWIGTTSGLYMFDGQRFIWNRKVGALAQGRVNAIQEDRQGNLWVCAGRIFRIRDDSVTMFEPKGLAKGFPAWCEYVDSGRVWFGTYGSGLHLIQGDTVVSFSDYTRDLGPNILSIREDSSGNLWLNAEHELQRMGKQRAIDVAGGKAATLDLRVYGASDGLNDIEFNGTGAHSSSVTKDGKFLYASLNGIVVADPAQAHENKKQPPVYVERCLADGREVPLSDAVEIPPGTREITIDFCALTFEAIPKVKFRYRLEGIDRNWVDLTSLRRTVSYGGVRPGNYTFRVMAANADGVWNTKGAVLTLSVLPYFYETTIFKVLGTLLAISLLVGGFRWRTSSLQAGKVELQKTVEERTAALKAEIEIRKGTEEELRLIQEGLEGRVAERTTQLSMAVEDLRKSREQYQKIVETAQEGILMTDADGVTVFANPKMAELLGCSIADLLGTTLDRYLDEAGKRQLDERKAHARKGLAERYELDFVKENRQRVSVVISSTPIFGDAGTYEGSLAMMADVSDQKKIERERIHVEEELRQVQKMEAVGHLAGGVAHDFNNLLIPILGYAEMLQAEYASDQKTAHKAATIRRAGEKAALLTKQLLSFSRRQVMESKTIDLNRVIRDFSPILQRTIREDVEIRYKLADDLRMIKGDASQIDQILINLLVNAKDAMPNGGFVRVETMNVSLDEHAAHASASLKPGPHVALIVSDSGLGMTADVLEHIFEPFFTTKEKGRGTGLGLATVYGIVKQHNGNIWVASTPNEGSEFKIYFPADEAVGTTMTELADTESEEPRGSATIVVTEDDEMVRQLVCTILEVNGYTVNALSGAEECLKFFRRSGGTVDMLLTDVIMPKMNGRELYAALAKEFPQLKVMFMSGYSEEVISHQGILEEGVAFIQKPFTSDALLKRVREVLKA